MAISMTEAAARHVNRYLSRRGKGVGVRLGVKTTGCSGLAYKLEYVDEILADDVVFYSPVVHTPQNGKAITLVYLSAAVKVLTMAARAICSILSGEMAERRSAMNWRGSSPGYCLASSA